MYTYRELVAALGKSAVDSPGAAQWRSQGGGAMAGQKKKLK